MTLNWPSRNNRDGFLCPFYQNFFYKNLISVALNGMHIQWKWIVYHNLHLIS